MKLIELEENTGIKNIHRLYSSLGEAIESNAEIVLDFRNVRRIDLAVAQVLIAVIRRAHGAGKIIKLQKVNDTIREQLVICGILK